MWALITPVIALIATYQFGVVTGNPIEIVKTNEPSFLISLLLLIPAGIVAFLLIVEKSVGWVSQETTIDFASAIQ
jgi:F0F1-type ATP synthase assembly protein I